MKQWSMEDGACFQYISDAFHDLSEEKKKMEIFDGPQIRQLIQDKRFAQSMTPVKRDAWLSFASVTKISKFYISFISFTD